MKHLKVLVFVLVIAVMILSACAGAQEAQKKTYCYITPGPDTWYKRDVEGFQAAAAMDNVDVIVVNSEYDVEKEH